MSGSGRLSVLLLVKLIFATVYALIHKKRSDYRTHRENRRFRTRLALACMVLGMKLFASLTEAKKRFARTKESP